MIRELPPASLESLGDSIVESSAQINAACAKRYAMIGEFDARGGWAEWGVLTCAHWLQVRTGATPAAAHDLVRVARALQALPQMMAAFSRGELSESAVRLMTRAADQNNEDVFLHFAKYGTGSHLAKLVRYYRQVLAVVEPEHEHAVSRYLRFRYDDDGSLRVYARFPAHEGALIRRAFQAVLDQLREDERAGKLTVDLEIQPEPEPEAPRAGDGGLHPDLAGALDYYPDREPEPERIEQPENDDDDDGERHRSVSVPIISDGPDLEERYADAMLLIAEGALAASPKVRANPDRYLVTVLVDQHTLRGQPSPNPRCELANGIPIRPEVARMLACDSSIVGMLVDERGNPLDVGRKTRKISKPMRRGLEARDPTCMFPECANIVFTDAHHRVPWFPHGQTKLPNLIRLCSKHHALVHAGAFTIESPAPHVFVFRHKQGWLIGRADLPPTIHDLQPVDPNACRPRWGGETCDYSVALEHLTQRHQPNDTS